MTKPSKDAKSDTDDKSKPKKSKRTKAVKTKSTKTKEKKKSGGRPTFVPTDLMRHDVELLMHFNLPQQRIADFLGISLTTFKKHFYDQIQNGVLKSNFNVAKALYYNAVYNNNVTAQIYWCKVRLGWVEPVPQPDIINPELAKDIKQLRGELELKNKSDY